MVISMVARWLRNRESLMAGSLPLRALFYSLIPGYIYAISNLLRTQHGAKIAGSVCPAYFQSCHRLYFLEPDWEGWSYRYFITILFFLLTASGIQALRSRWMSAFALLAPLFLASAWALLATHADVSVGYVVFLLVPTAVLLFSNRPLDDMRVSFVLLYALAGISKIHPGWLAGTYFASYNHGLPLVPNSLIPVVTNAAILLEVAGSWWLLGPSPKGRLVALSLISAFHAYSVILIGAQFAVQALPFLWILFHLSPISMPRPGPLGIVLGLGLTVVNVIPFVLSDNPKLTYQGQSLAMSMFDANRKSISTVTYTTADGTDRVETRGSQTTWDVLKPYKEMKHIQASCGPGVRANWTFDTSLDDGPFQRIIDVPDACGLSFRPFARNDWIKEAGPVVGYPQKVAYRPQQQMGSVPTRLGQPQPRETYPLESWPKRHLKFLRGFHLVIMCLALILVGLGWKAHLRKLTNS